MEAPQDSVLCCSCARRDYLTRQFVRRQQRISFLVAAREEECREGLGKGVKAGAVRLRVTCPFCLHAALRGFRFVLLRFDSIFSCFFWLTHTAEWESGRGRLQEAGGVAMAVAATDRVAHIVFAFVLAVAFALLSFSLARLGLHPVPVPALLFFSL